MDSDTKENIISFLHSLDHYTTYVHGDFNPNNVMISNGELLLIDMSEFTIGCPMFDLAALYFSFFYLHTYEDDEFNAFTGMTGAQQRRLWDVFIQEYFKVGSYEEALTKNSEARLIKILTMIKAAILLYYVPDKFPQEFADKVKREICECFQNTTDYLCESQLKKQNNDLHSRFQDSVLVMQNILKQYQRIFPYFTDHTELHSMEVIELCNKLIGENISRLNADEMYILLMSCYLHDSGMGITDQNYQEFSKQIDFKGYFESHDREDIMAVVRDFHNEFSGRYISKYAQLFDIPSKEHEFAIVQVSRGHRKTDLYDEQEYPSDLRLPNGNKVCVVYLAALLRLADELDVTVSRNPSLLYDTSKLIYDIDIKEFGKHQAIKGMMIQKDKFVMQIDTCEKKTFRDIVEQREKMLNTLHYCRNVVHERTPFEISQTTIELNKLSRQ